MRRSLACLAALVFSGFMLGGLPALVGETRAAEPQTESAESAWSEIRPLVFDDRPILSGDGLITLQAPFRPKDQSFVPVEMTADLRDGRTIKAVTFIVDENPVPVVATFDIGGKRTSLKLATHFRFNRQTQLRAVVEASDGQLYMASRFVRFAGGQAACAAPPMGDPASIAANMGRMGLAHEKSAVAGTQIRPNATLTVNHPNHTGMVLDQISLLYIPMRVLSDIEVRQGDELVFAMHGSMSLSQNPEIRFDYHVNGADAMEVTASDTDDAAWTQRFAIGHGS